ncbi:MAG: S41 family peptidase [Pseudonocardia sp.]|nr:S41 family peptidase [Pseudonocardia sp.]
MIGKSGRDRKAVERALDAMQERALHSDRVDWAAARAEVAAAVGDQEALELALFRIVRQAGGPHSGLRGPAMAHGAPELPAVRVEGDAAVLTLPGCSARDARDYEAAGRAALATANGAERWIVDLRGNGGGSMWPMLAVVAPLLRPGPEGRIGAFVDRAGGSTPWRLLPGALLAGRRPMARASRESLSGPVAVLTDGGTAGSGEAVAVAFRGVPDVRSYGSPTLGFSTGNETLPLPGGSVLTVTTSRFADRTGQLYGARIIPDVPGDDPLSLALWDS